MVSTASRACRVEHACILAVHRSWVRYQVLGHPRPFFHEKGARAHV